LPMLKFATCTTFFPWSIEPIPYASRIELTISFWFAKPIITLLLEYGTPGRMSKGGLLNVATMEESWT
jgi:hypothetical protein